MIKDDIEKAIKIFQMRNVFLSAYIKIDKIKKDNRINQVIKIKNNVLLYNEKILNKQIKKYGYISLYEMLHHTLIHYCVMQRYR